jgi:hypothetical protein
LPEGVEPGIARLAAERRRPDEEGEAVANLGDPRGANVGENLQVQAVLLLVLLVFYTLCKYSICRL